MHIPKQPNINTTHEPLQMYTVTRVHHDHVEDHHNDVVLVVEPLRDSVLVLDAQEFCDYLEYEGLWKSTTEESVITNDRPVLQRNEYLANMVEAVINITTTPPAPKQIAVIPSVPLRISVIGKRYSGKNTISKLAANYNMTILRLDELIKDAIRFWVISL
jgi:hypothetical protein